MTKRHQMRSLLRVSWKKGSSPKQKQQYWYRCGPASHTLFPGHRMGQEGSFSVFRSILYLNGNRCLWGALGPFQRVLKYWRDCIRSPDFYFRIFMSQFLHLSAIVLVLFCLLLANTEACYRGKREGGELVLRTAWLHQKKVKNHRT